MVSQLSPNAIAQCVASFSHNMDTHLVKRDHTKNDVLKNKEDQKLERRKNLPKCSCKVEKKNFKLEQNLFNFMFKKKNQH